MQSRIKNIEKAAERITKAVKNKESIILYGDSDMDGIASVVILEESIKNLGGTVTAVAFPDRENDGYGINFKALEHLKDKAPALFITLDLGIGNVKEVDVANGLGFEVIIIDHHEILTSIPNASIIVDPQQKDDKYPFKGLANVGVTFKVCEELLRDNFSGSLRNSFLELTALATIADMVPQVEDNKMFIEEGLRSMKNTYRPALKAFLEILGEGEMFSGGYFKMISAFNSAESVAFRNESYALLTNPSQSECLQKANELIGKSQAKQMRIKEIANEVDRRILEKPSETVIFEGDPSWRLTLAGAVASIIASKHEKPTFIYKKLEKESCGSVRSLKEGQDSVEAMKSCRDLLITYGGHPKASGFRVKNENVEAFKGCLAEYFNNLSK